jgi:hypothetical protein
MSNETKLSGRIISFGEIQTGTGNKGVWKKREIILETNGQYPKKVCLTAWNNVCDSLSNYQVEDSLTVQCYIESREYNSRWYTEIKPFKVVD